MDFKRDLDTVAAAEKGFDYVIRDLDDNETDAVISVVGVGSRIFKQAKQKIDNQEAAYAKRGKTMDEELSNELWIELLSACTKGWKNVEEDGKQVEFTPDNVVRMYTSYPVLRNQVLAAIHDIKSMLEGNSQSYTTTQKKPSKS